MGEDVRMLLGEGAPAGCHSDVASFHGRDASAPVALPMPTVRRDPVPAAGPGLAGVGASGGVR